MGAPWNQPLTENRSRSLAAARTSETFVKRRDEFFRMSANVYVCSCVCVCVCVCVGVYACMHYDYHIAAARTL